MPPTPTPLVTWLTFGLSLLMLLATILFYWRTIRLSRGQLGLNQQQYDTTLSINLFNEMKSIAELYQQQNEAMRATIGRLEQRIGELERLVTQQSEEIHRLTSLKRPSKPSS